MRGAKGFQALRLRTANMGMRFSAGVGRFAGSQAQLKTNSKPVIAIGTEPEEH